MKKKGWITEKHDKLISIELNIEACVGFSFGKDKMENRKLAEIMYQYGDITDLQALFDNKNSGVEYGVRHFLEEVL